VFLKDRKEERWFGDCQTSDYGGWGWKARGIALGSGRERLSRISERPLFLFLDLMEVCFDLIHSHFDLIFFI
ncbi:hypothetical protein, partial [Fictibacillus sp. 5RED26]|uniref:hypothetical protein n=1 Tax=Fictibacillus sp. 5RED26 TaxID=2745876 RepID=UPI001E38D5E8